MEGQFSIAVIGQSHTAALYRGMPRDERFSIVDTNTVKPSWLTADGKITEEFLAGYPAESGCVSMLGGNFHVVFGLVEHRVKLDFFSRDSSFTTIDDSREIIPYHLMREFFKNSLRKTVLSPMAQLRDHFKGEMLHVCSPPYFPSSEHVHKYPYYFKDKLEFGVTPAPIRKKLFDLHTNLIAEHCKAIGVRFIAPPSESVDVDGFLLKDYWSLDSSHANEKYGALLYGQIVRELSQ